MQINVPVLALQRSYLPRHLPVPAESGPHGVNDPRFTDVARKRSWYIYVMWAERYSLDSEERLPPKQPSMVSIYCSQVGPALITLYNNLRAREASSFTLAVFAVHLQKEDIKMSQIMKELTRLDTSLFSVLADVLGGLWYGLHQTSQGFTLVGLPLQDEFTVSRLTMEDLTRQYSSSRRGRCFPSVMPAAEPSGRCLCTKITTWCGKRLFRMTTLYMSSAKPDLTGYLTGQSR